MILIIIISNSFKEEVLLAIIMAQAVESNDLCYLDMLPLEILEIIFMYALSPDFVMENHVCWTFKNALSVIPRFKVFEDKARKKLPMVYISNVFGLPKGQKSGQIVVNMRRVIANYGSNSGLVIELIRLICHPRWNSVCLVLIPDAYSWFILKDLYWK